MKIIKAPWLFKYFLRGYAAITIRPYVFVKGRVGEITLNHERIHLDQQKRDGLIKFTAKYLYEYFRNLIKYKSHAQAYYRISYEIEAYKHQYDLDYKVKG